MTKHWISQANKFRLVAVLLFIPLVAASYFVARVDAKPFIYGGNSYPIWMIVFSVGALFIFLVAIVPTLGTFGKWILELIKARRGAGQ